jgi:hypothetical protein
LRELNWALIQRGGAAKLALSARQIDVEAKINDDDDDDDNAKLKLTMLADNNDDTTLIEASLLLRMPPPNDWKPRMPAVADHALWAMAQLAIVHSSVNNIDVRRWFTRSGKVEEQFFVN